MAARGLWWDWEKPEDENAAGETNTKLQVPELGATKQPLHIFGHLSPAPQGFMPRWAAPS